MIIDARVAQAAPHRSAQRHECPKCGQAHVGSVDGPVEAQPLLDGSVEHWRLRQFPCHHCAIVVCWRQACDADGRFDGFAGARDRLSTGYLTRSAYARWCERHREHAEVFHEEEGVGA